jgi:hypothetical protein
MNALNYVINIVFIFEMVIKIIALGFIMDSGSYLRESWNIMDFCIVLFSILDMSLSQINITFLRILRMIRVLRPLRIISHNKDIKIMVVALIESVDSIFNVGLVIAVVFLIFGIVGVNLQGGKYFRCTIDFLTI